MERARKIWEELGLPALSPQPPWHGYTLGDWNDDWETYAKRAVTGDWEQSGKETFAQKRGGLTPETPVRDADKAAKAGTDVLRSCCTAVLPKSSLAIQSEQPFGRTQSARPWPNIRCRISTRLDHGRNIGRASIVDLN